MESNDVVTGFDAIRSSIISAQPPSTLSPTKNEDAFRNQRRQEDCDSAGHQDVEDEEYLEVKPIDGEEGNQGSGFFCLKNESKLSGSFLALENNFSIAASSDQSNNKVNFSDEGKE